MYVHMFAPPLPPSSGPPGASSPWPLASSPSSPTLCDPHCGKEGNTCHEKGLVHTLSNKERKNILLYIQP